MKSKKMIRILAAAMMVAALCCTPALAAGDVASAVESTWSDAATQIKTVVDNVVFPALDRPGNPVRLSGLHPHRPLLHLGHHRDLSAIWHPDRSYGRPYGGVIQTLSAWAASVTSA